MPPKREPSEGSDLPGVPEAGAASTHPEWTTAVDGTSRIYFDLVRVACSAQQQHWLGRIVGTAAEEPHPLTHPVHGWLQRRDRAVRSVHGSDRTLCGLRIEDLRWRDLQHLTWVDVEPDLRCRICAVVLEQ